MSHQYDILILPGTIAGTWYDCDVNDRTPYGNEYDSYDECFESCIASGIDAQHISPEGYMGWVVIE